MKASKCFKVIETTQEKLFRKARRKYIKNQRSAVNKGKYKLRTFLKQKGICHYCERNCFIDDWTVDHVVPLSKGGKTEKKNVIGCCMSCNHQKANFGYSYFKEKCIQ